jgi:hypothetical protein
MENSLLNIPTGLPPQVLGVFSGLAWASIVSLVAILIIWTIVWKGLALWKAARSGHKWWFIIMLIVNTAGILELIYYFFVNKNGRRK